MRHITSHKIRKNKTKTIIIYWLNELLQHQETTRSLRSTNESRLFTPRTRIEIIAKLRVDVATANIFIVYLATSTTPAIC